ncbi:MAG: chaperonin GroEL [Chloroflexota bacterium]|nr:chaperonin GroEL [Chloroflexota bacterium]
MAHPRLAFEPAARQSLRKGFNALAAVMEVALGPRGRLVAVAQDNRRKAPELLDDGATIARRFLGLPNRFETMGAFMARHIAWRMEETVGDGATTAVVIARQVLNEADRHIAAGYNPMRLRHGLEKTLTVALQALDCQAQPLASAAQICALATAITADATLGGYIEEAFDTVGAHGAVDVRTGYARSHSREYIAGTFWNQGWVSSYFTTEGGKAILKDPYILLTNCTLEKAAELLPIMTKIREAGSRGLVVIATGVTGDALNILVANKMRHVLPTLAIKAPGLGPEKNEILQDLAVQCGGKLFLQEAGHKLEAATLLDLGQADEVQAIRSGFTLIGGKGRPAAMRERMLELRRQIPQAAYGRERERLTERAGKLLGGVALLHIGGATEIEQEHRKERAKEAVRTVRLGLQAGVVPGGGVAFLRCLPALDALVLPAEEAPALAILRSALLAPIKAILRNSGFEPNPIIERIRQSSNGCGFDVMQGKLVDVVAQQIVDPVTVLHTALQTGVSGALMALTTEVLVHKPRHNRNQAVDFRP